MAERTVVMTGGSPWGFKMTGGKDFHQPLAIGKVTPGGKANRAGVREGDLIQSVNGADFANLSHHEALNKIKNAGHTLTLHLGKAKPSSPPAPPAYSKTAPDSVSIPSSVDTSYKAGEHRFTKYEHEENWQKEGPVQQSPSMSKVLTKSVKPPSITAETKKLTITSDIKEMLEEEEATKGAQSGGMRASAIKTWPTHDNSSSNGVAAPAAPAPGPNGDRSKAIGNISKFIQGGTKYGEPTFAKPLQDIASPLGDPAVLEVRIGPNLPVPSVHWYHNNKPARESKDRDIRFLSNGPVHTLVLGELSTELLGTYTCTIMNKNGSCSTRCRVTVKTDSTSSNHYNKPAVQSYQPPVSAATDSKRVIPSTSLGLYSSQNARESYQGQMKKSPTREDNEESEVMKALREEGPQKHAPKTRAMKFLEESLLPESDDL